MGRLVILSGPSCVGKGPLHAALRKFYPDLASRLPKLVLYDSRAPRPGEVDGVDYHFRSREYVEGLRDSDRFRVFEVRGDLQALDTADLQERLARSDVLFEGNPFIGSGLLEVAEAVDVEQLSVFLSPFSREEVLAFRGADGGASLRTLVTDVMRRKLLRRTTRHKGILSLKDLENVEIRATSAYTELQRAWRFDFVIPNHDGEDSDHWDAFYRPIGDARRAMLAFVGLLQGTRGPHLETWERDLVP